MTIRRPRVLVVGASGQVGSAVVRGLALSYDVVSTRRTRNAPGPTVVPGPTETSGWPALLQELRPTAVVVTAALTDVDACERDPDLSREVNVDLVTRIASAADQRGAHVIYFSTDYVFSGEHGPYREQDPPGPVNVYGAHKLAGEQVVSAADGAVLRTSWVYGGNREGAVDQIVHLLRQGPLEAPDSQLATPTWAPDLAWLVGRIVDERWAGVLHAAGPETLTRFEVARRVAVVAGFPVGHVRASRSPSTSGRAPRPQRCGLVVDRARELFDYHPTPFDVGVARHLDGAS